MPKLLIAISGGEKQSNRRKPSPLKTNGKICKLVPSIISDKRRNNSPQRTMRDVVMIKGSELKSPPKSSSRRKLDSSSIYDAKIYSSVTAKVWSNYILLAAILLSLLFWPWSYLPLLQDFKIKIEGKLLYAYRLQHRPCDVQ